MYLYPYDRNRTDVFIFFIGGQRVNGLKNGHGLFNFCLYCNMLQVRYIRIDGSVPSAERIHLVNQFQKDPDTRVAILSIQAAGQVGQKRKYVTYET